MLWRLYSDNDIVCEGSGNLVAEYKHSTDKGWLGRDEEQREYASFHAAIIWLWWVKPSWFILDIETDAGVNEPEPRDEADDVWGVQRSWESEAANL